MGLMHLYQHHPEALTPDMLLNVWVGEEYPTYSCENHRDWAKLFNDTILRTHILDNSDKTLNCRFWEALPEEIIVYRGVGSVDELDGLVGLSWSLSEKVAQWFAKRFDDEGIVLKGRIKKRDCIAYLGLHEHEVILQPDALLGITYNA